ncbi:hypothetical protein CBS9595_004103 [Malassezia furfur]|nr:hypothetical protein CBS9595_004103 [Malassezia furfur]
MSAAPRPPALVPPSAARTQARDAVERACALLATPQRPEAEAALLAFAARPTLVDDAAFVLAHADAPDVHFHVLGALLSQLPRIDAEDATRSIHSVVTLRDWLLQDAAAVARPPYVVARQTRTAVLLTKRASAPPDAAPLVSLGQHATALVQSDAHAPLGLQLAVAIAEDLGAETPRTDDVRVGLTADAHAWCHAVTQVHVLPTLLPAALAALHGALGDVGRLVPAADATHALLAWKWNAALPANGAQLAPAQLLEALQRPARDGARGVPLALAELLFSPALPGVLSDAARAAHRAAEAVPAHAWAAQRAALELRTSLQTLAALEPSDETAGLWAQQRTALAAALAAYVDETSARVAHAASAASVADDVEVLRVLAHIYVALVGGRSGRALLGTASDTEGVLRALAVLTHATFRAALDVLPASAADDAEALAEADAAVTEVLALWRALTHALAAADVPPAVLAAVHAHVRDHVVLAYQAGRLHAARLAADADVDEVGDEQTSDAELYDEQLTLYAALARTCLDEALGALGTALDALQAELAAQAAPATWEQLHWAALLAGHLVADAAAAEEPCVPYAVAEGGAEVHARVLALVHSASLVVLPALLPHGPSDAHAASPLAVASLLWTTARWVPTYLLRDDAPPALAHALAGAAGAAVLDAVVAHVQTALDAWRSDADVLTAAARLLEALAHTPGAMAVVLARPAMQALVSNTLGALETLPEDAHAPLLRAVVQCLDHARDGPEMGADDARAAYYPLVLRAVDARLAAAMHARTQPHLAPSVHAALRLVEVLGACADPYTSRSVQARLQAQLPCVVQLAQALTAHPDVLSAALDATSAVVRAAEDAAGGPLAPDVLRAVHDVLAAVRPALHEADDEALLVRYLHLVQALAQLGTSAELPTTPPAGGAAGSAAPSAAAVACVAFADAAPLLTHARLSVVAVREALAEGTTSLLLKCGAALLQSAVGPPPDAPSPLDAPPEAHVAPLAVRDAAPLPTVLRSAAYLFGTADTTTDAHVAALAPALGLLVAKVPEAPAAQLSAPLVQASLDALAWDVVRALLLRALHPPSLAPLVLALRAVTLARVRAAWLGGQATYLASLEAACAAAPTPHRAALAQAVQHLLQRILASQPEAPAAGVAPALAARLLAKEEQAACIALCRTLRPYVLQTRGALCVQ